MDPRKKGEKRTGQSIRATSLWISVREKKKKLTMRDGSCQMRDNRRLMDEILKKKRKRKLGSAHLLLRNKFNVVAQHARNVDAHLLLKLNTNKKFRNLNTANSSIFCCLTIRIASALLSKGVHLNGPLRILSSSSFRFNEANPKRL